MAARTWLCGVGARLKQVFQYNIIMCSPCVMSAAASNPIIKHDIKLPNDQRKVAFVLENVLSIQECEDYIHMTEKKGYEKALVNIGGGKQKLMTDIRNSDRCIIDSFDEADKLWQRINEYVPTMFNGRKALALNERLRFLRYDKGQYFAPHMDGVYMRENGERSYVTVQVYLNEGFKGGSTTFLPNSVLWGNSREGAVEVVPKTGSVLIFQHDILHEGSTLNSGRKYAVRTDVMYAAEKSV